MKFQIVNMKTREGTSRAGNQYKMLNVTGVFTSDDGVVECGEISFFDRPQSPVPTHLVAGQTYTPTLGAISRDGKLEFVISELKPIMAAAKAA